VLAWQLVEVICDTSFLIVLVSKPVKGMDQLEINLGKLQFVVPTVVIKELSKLASSAGVKRAKEAKLALELANEFKVVQMDGTVADDLIIDYALKHRCLAATIDDGLKNKLLRNGINVITLSNNKLIVV
jgi:rRNA-processing protein FCF1